ncbi:MAG TPA: xanthine dehydrogenase family protein molybdopterin-binding subunit [Rhizomicrobium sp.]|jgi:xanthine dehydrogenase YagR molybdenum-binding subunit
MTAIGTAIPRIDGPAKVRGAARYASDFAVPKPAYAFLVTSPIARGRITNIDESETRGLPGVIDVLTYRNVGDAVKPGNIFAKQGYMGTSIAPLASEKIWHDGQIVGVVLAETFEEARDGAHRLKFVFAEEKPSASFGSPGAQEIAVKAVSEQHEDPQVGDAAKAFATAPAKIDAEYATPTQHHNPIELFTTTCAWNDGKLTVWEGSQSVYGYKNGVAEQLGIPPDNVHVISPFIGGAFGSRGSLTQRTAIIAFAARKIGRPVKLVATREQGFTIATYRAETRHRIKLGAAKDGKLVSLSHEGWEVTSRPDDYSVSGTDASTRLYACPNVYSKVSIVRADRNTPGFMRSPPETPYLYALESAMDELAYALEIDPVELRRINDTMKEPIKGLPYTSRSLMKCFDAAAKAFGWQQRDPKPGSMREGDWLIGWGTATTMYPTNVAAATARVTLYPDGRARVESATHDIGTGAYTVLALTASDKLGIPVEAITVETGDSALPPAPVAGGSNSTASVCNVVAKACDEILAKKAGGANGVIEAYAENIPHGVKPDAIPKLYRGHPSFGGGANLKDRIQFAFGAQFVEVRVHRMTGEIRAPRAVGAFAAGKIVNPTTAESNLMGGMIWGISCALHEATEIDRRYARYYNDDIAEYMIPVNADIDKVQVIIVPEEDTEVNPLGIKGLGELGNVGMNAAVANAVYHATGVRVRELPIRLEKILHAPALALDA